MIRLFKRNLKWAVTPGHRAVAARFAAAAMVLAALILLSGCATRRLPPFEPRLRKTEFQTVRTTAYTHTESDHRKYGRRNALGTTLLHGEVNSAAADWARWPAGTIFRILPDGPVHVVDDYGWMLSGTNTIDLYKPSRFEMNHWGVRRVDIQILQWGDPHRSAAVLRPRRKHKHVARMLKEFRSQGIR
jgi:3D (Asp-Asp-Asp) domain-containing protein